MGKRAKQKAAWTPLLFTLYFLWLIPHLFFDRAGALWAGFVNVWADWSTHLAYAHHFAFKPPSLWLTQNPLFVGESLHYPFLVNFLSSLFLRLGLPATFALGSVSLVGLLGALWMAHRFFQNHTDRTGAALGVGLLFLGGSLGFTLFFKDLFTLPNPGAQLLFPLKEYGHINEAGLSYGGHLSCLWLPQRTFPWGAFVGLLFLWGIVRPPLAPHRAIRVGIVAGLLPIIHIHSFLALLITLPFFVLEKRRATLAYRYQLVSFLLTAAVIWITFHHGGPPQNFLAWQPGWITGASSLWWPIYWVWNWSFFLPLVLLAIFTVKPLAGRWLTYSGLSLFLLANLVRFQPWDWDNTKLFVWSYLLLIPAVVQVLRRAMGRARWWRWGALTLYASLVFTGGLEALRLLNTGALNYPMFSAQERAWAQKLREQTSPQAVILSSTSAHDWVVSLAGRQVVMGYNGWLWSYGIDFAPRENEIRSLYQNPAQPELLQKYGITHIVIDPKVREIFSPRESAFAHLPVLFQDDTLTVYTLASKSGGS